MKALKTILMVCLCVMPLAMTARKKSEAVLKNYPEIKFEKTTIDLGIFSEDEPVRTCVFKFTNVGKAKLVINYVSTSCGCTNVEYPKDYISPGGSGEIKVTYDGKGKLPGKFKKVIQVFSNCKNDLSRLFINGEMSALPASELKK